MTFLSDLLVRSLGTVIQPVAESLIANIATSTDPADMPTKAQIEQMERELQQQMVQMEREQQQNRLFGAWSQAQLAAQNQQALANQQAANMGVKAKPKSSNNPFSDQMWGAAWFKGLSADMVVVDDLLAEDDVLAKLPPPTGRDISLADKNEPPPLLHALHTDDLSAGKQFQAILRAFGAGKGKVDYDPATRSVRIILQEVDLTDDPGPGGNIRSPLLLAAAKDQSCVNCGAKDGTVVACHYEGIRSNAFGKGTGIKPHDLCVADLCATCHAQFDSKEGSMVADPYQRKIDLSERFMFCVMVTLFRRVRQGVLKV